MVCLLSLTGCGMSMKSQNTRAPVVYKCQINGYQYSQKSDFTLNPISKPNFDTNENILESFRNLAKGYNECKIKLDKIKIRNQKNDDLINRFK